MKNPFDPGYYTEADLKECGFKSIGSNVKIDRTSSIFGLKNIEIGNNVRIDGYCSISAVGGHIRIGSHVHVAAYCLLAGGGGIELEDFSGLSHGVKVYSRTDDYTGKYMTNPTVPEELTGVVGGLVRVCRHAIIGSGTVILPKVIIGEGSAVGAQCLVTKSLDPWGVYFGCPAKRLKSRSKRLLELEAKMYG